MKNSTAPKSQLIPVHKTYPLRIFSSALFPPVQYFVHLEAASEACIEVFDRYERQSYRNRYLLYGANGPLTLSVPVVKPKGKQVPMKDVRLSYDTPWHQIHWKSIEAAYNSSPYYLYYKDELEPLFSGKWKYLLDLNQKALELTMAACDIATPLRHTTQYHTEYPNALDLRNQIHPKLDFKKDCFFIPQSYRQVFGWDKAFVPNLSILDLLFNKGPESLLVLRDSLLT